MPSGVRHQIAFVLPYFDDGQPWRRQALRETLASLSAQSDPHWHAYLVDDASPSPSTSDFLTAVAMEHGSRLTVLRAPVNAGAGPARNLGVQVASERGHRLIAFLDSDDQAHPERVSTVRQRFADDSELAFLYCDIEFIDEHGQLWDQEDLLPALRFIAEEQQLPKVRGRLGFVTQAVERDCVAIPSAMNLRTELALRFPFPQVRFCEDVATLFRYLGCGAQVDHAHGIPTLYRVPSVGASASRALAGDLEQYNLLRCVNERAGLEEAIGMSIARGDIDPNQGREILTRYLIRIGRTVAADGNTDLGGRQLRAARELDPAIYSRYTDHSDHTLADHTLADVGSQGQVPVFATGADLDQ